MPKIEIRVTAEQRSTVKAAADARGLTTSEYARSCLGLEDLPAARDPSLRPYRCPARGCDKRFGSAAAVCPRHGRKCVPV